MDYLAHHGIQGQKWGQRNGPPYPLDASTYKLAQYRQKAQNNIAKNGLRPDQLRQRHVVPAGTTIYRTTTNPNEDVSGLKYVSYYDADRQHYRGGWVRNAQQANKSYENTYTLQKDIVVPSRQELSDVIKSVIDQDPKRYTKEIGDHLFNMMYPEGSWDREEASYDAMTGEYSKKGLEKCKKMFLNGQMNNPVNSIYYTAAQTFGTNVKLRNKVIEELKKRGYNAMTDEASVGGQNGWAKEGIDPLILFDGGILQKNNTKEISSRKEQKSIQKYYKWKRNVSKQNSAQWSGI